jgi:hypothetical protein
MHNDVVIAPRSDSNKTVHSRREKSIAAFAYSPLPAGGEPNPTLHSYSDSQGNILSRNVRITLDFLLSHCEKSSHSVPSYFSEEESVPRVESRLLSFRQARFIPRICEVCPEFEQGGDSEINQGSQHEDPNKGAVRISSVLLTI